ncbi:tetratricopeptide repeat protein [Luethyella okanaganae]|uniref:Tetratricopeptide repeat protein n=1 Tax=Luethyella okanaganae TaxID=69372 RepID=A0ABW1VEV1_9MICO
MTNLPPSTANLRGAVDLSSLVNRPQPSAEGGTAGAAVEVPSLLLEGTDDNFGEVLDLSFNVPVIVHLWAERSEPSRRLTSLLEKITREFDGRIVLVKVQADQNPQLAQAFQAQSVPTVAALVAGRPVQLFEGTIPEDQLRSVFDQVLQLAAQNSVTGIAAAADAGDGEPGEPDEAAPAEQPLPPHHAEAYDAIERGDYAEAITHYETAIAEDPRDHLAVAGLAQISLVQRLQDKSLDEIRSAAASAPGDVDAQLDVADLDLSGGHIEDAFDRLLTLFPTLDADGKNRVRERLLDFFEVVGPEDPTATTARGRLAMLLY